MAESTTSADSVEQSDAGTKTTAKRTAAKRTSTRTKAAAPASGFQPVKLYNRNGEEQEATTPARLVALEFDGWARDKSVFKS